MLRYLLLAVGVLSLLAGLVLSVAWFTTPQPSQSAAQRPEPKETILSAAHPIPAGMLLRLEDMAWIEVPQTALTTASLIRGRTTENEFVGAIARRAFAEREAIVASGVAKPGERDFLVVALAPGHRAVSISVDAAQVTSGLLTPGDRVDVVLTQNFTQAHADLRQKTVGETVLRDLRVIALDQNYNPAVRPGEGKPGTTMLDFRPPKTVTLEVSEQEAETLLVADQLGKVQLALRGRADPSARPVQGRRTWAADVSRALQEVAGQGPPGAAPPAPSSALAAPSPVVAPPPAPPLISSPDQAPSSTPPPAPPQSVIEVVRGNKIEHRCATARGLVTCP